jgi:hypothetical protein
MTSEPLWAYLAHLDPGSFKFQINIKPLFCSDFLIKSLLKMPSEPLWAYLGHLDIGTLKIQINIKPQFRHDFFIKSY